MNNRIRTLKDQIKKLSLRRILEEKHGMIFDCYGRTRCLFHDDHNPSMSVRQDSQGNWRGYCFKCGKGGDYIDIRMELDGQGFLDTVENIAIEEGLVQNGKEVHACR